jgi:hypothetical protein
MKQSDSVPVSNYILTRSIQNMAAHIKEIVVCRAVAMQLPRDMRIYQGRFRAATR